MFKYSGRTLRSLQLHRLAIAVESDVHARVLDELGSAIKKCCDRAEEIHEDNEAALDGERELIESLLGTAFVICQTKITDVAARANDLTGKTKRELRSLGPRFNAEISQIDVLWELANFFKHGDEWAWSDWDEPKGQRQETVRILKAAGVTGGTGPLRTGAKALGAVDYFDTAAFRQVVDDWSAEVANSVKTLPTIS